MLAVAVLAVSRLCAGTTHHTSREYGAKAPTDEHHKIHATTAIGAERWGSLIAVKGPTNFATNYASLKDLNRQCTSTRRAGRVVLRVLKTPCPRWSWARASRLKMMSPWTGARRDRPGGLARTKFILRLQV